LKNKIFREELFPFLIRLLKEDKEKRNDGMIKCILNSLLTFIFSGKDRDYEIPEYYMCLATNIKNEYSYLETVHNNFLI
jgi:hypothetical protein